MISQRLRDVLFISCRLCSEQHIVFFLSFDSLQPKNNSSNDSENDNDSNSRSTNTQNTRFCVECGRRNTPLTMLACRLRDMAGESGLHCSKCCKGRDVSDTPHMWVEYWEFQGPLNDEDGDDRDYSSNPERTRSYGGAWYDPDDRPDSDGSDDSMGSLSNFLGWDDDERRYERDYARRRR